MQFFSTYNGTVVNVNDPLQLGRLQVRVPLVYGPMGTGAYASVSDFDLPWADPAGMPQGGSAQSGAISFLPLPGDRVYVRFLDGEPEKPIWEWAAQDLTQQQAYPANLYDTPSHNYDTPGGQISENTPSGTPVPIPASSSSSANVARVTYYAAYEDQTNGSLTSTGVVAQQGTTVAVDPSLIPYGSAVTIPGLQNTLVGSSSFVAQDTGSAVVSKQASGGTAPVIDVYVNATDAADFNSKVANIEASLQQQYPGYSGYIPYSVTPPQGASVASESSLNQPAFAPGASSGLLKNASYSPSTTSPATPAKRAAFSRYGHVLEFNPISIIMTTATGYYLVLQDGGATDPASGVITLGTPSFYLELDNEAEVLQTYVPHIQYLTTSWKVVNLQDMQIDTADWTLLAKKDIYEQAENDFTLEANAKFYIKSDSDMSVVSNAKLDIIAAGTASISAPTINLGGSGGKPNPFIRQSDLQYVVNQINQYLTTHVHSNGDFGTPTGPPIIPPIPGLIPASTVVFETTGAPNATGGTQLAAPDPVPQLPVA